MTKKGALIGELFQFDRIKKKTRPTIPASFRALHPLIPNPRETPVNFPAGKLIGHSRRFGAAREPANPGATSGLAPPNLGDAGATLPVSAGAVVVTVPALRAHPHNSATALPALHLAQSRLDTLSSHHGFDLRGLRLLPGV